MCAPACSLTQCPGHLLGKNEGQLISGAPAHGKGSPPGPEPVVKELLENKPQLASDPTSAVGRPRGPLHPHRAAGAGTSQQPVFQGATLPYGLQIPSGRLRENTDLVIPQLDEQRLPQGSKESQGQGSAHVGNGGGGTCDEYMPSLSSNSYHPQQHLTEPCTPTSAWWPLAQHLSGAPAPEYCHQLSRGLTFPRGEWPSAGSSSTRVQVPTHPQHSTPMEPKRSGKSRLLRCNGSQLPPRGQWVRSPGSPSAGVTGITKGNLGALCP